MISIEQLATQEKISELKVNSTHAFWLQSDKKNKSRQYLKYISDNNENMNYKGSCLTDSLSYNIKSCINEYGGGSYWLDNNHLYFFNKDDQSIYLIDISNLKSDDFTKPKKLKATSSNSENVDYNYSDGICHKYGFIAVREQKQEDSTKQCLVFYSLATDEVFVLDSASDFYSFPRFNQKTKQLLWLSWQHPNMPWDKNQLFCADFDNDRTALANVTCLVASEKGSMYQPEWNDDGTISVVIENEGDAQPFWNLEEYSLKEKKFTRVINISAEQGIPSWQLSTNTYTRKNDNKESSIYGFYLYNGNATIYEYDSNSKEVKIISDDFCYIQDNIYIINNNLYFIANTLSRSFALYRLNLDTEKIFCLDNLDSKKRTIQEQRIISTAKEVSFSNNFSKTSFGFYYPPSITTSTDNKLPPLIVMCHGGPTGTTNPGYNLKVQFWTSRGFAVIDVNYSGSTTYGRNYRQRIKHQWGIIDVDDCAAAADYCINHKLVNKDKIFIKGNSAGGLLALTALYKYDVFTAGCCYYPVCDLLSLDMHMHNFEKYYNTFLIGDPADTEQYVQRSPISFADKITKPVLIIHGDSDSIVPIEQSQELFSRLQSNHPQNRFIKVDNEGHGFRTLEGIQQSITQELEFYSLFI